MPEIERLRATKTDFRQLPAIYYNEGTIAGTYGVYEDIFIKYLHLPVPDWPSEQADNNFPNQPANQTPDDSLDWLDNPALRRFCHTTMVNTW